MITTGDIQYEPDGRRKLYSLTTSIAIMTAGDTSFLSPVVRALFLQVTRDLEAASNQWLRVSAVVDHYVRLWSEAKAKQAEAVLLAPLSLNRVSFLNQQKTLDTEFVMQMASKLINFEVAQTSAIITGNDDEGTHIYRVDDANIYDFSTIGFATIGIGERHADSQFMLARHSWNSPLANTLFLAYSAKRRAEIAPGVGKETDLAAIVGLGGYTDISSDVREALEAEYLAVIAGEEALQSAARGNIQSRLDELARRQAQAQQGPESQETTPPGDTGPVPSPSG
jgi:hypothetical protein